MTGSLCNALSGQVDGQESLQHLEQENVFIVPLDNHRQWYRYHHLFADVLRQRLTESASPGEIKKLHQYASQWFEERDSLIEAVEHMLRAEEYGEVIRLIDASAEKMFIDSQLNTLLKWHDKLPHELIEIHPRLCLIFAWAWVTTGQADEAEHCLQATEKALGQSLDELFCGTAIDAATRGALLETAVVRAQLAIGRGAISEALKLTGFALPYLESNDCPFLYNPPIGSRMAACFIRGLAQKLSGDLTPAEKSFEEAGELGKNLNHVHIVALAHGHLASIQAIQGHLHQAIETCQQGLGQVQEMTGINSPLSGFLRAIYGNLLYEMNDLKSAETHIREALTVAKPWNFVDAFVPGFIGLAQIRTTQGDWEAAFAALNELETLGQNHPQLVKPIVDAYRTLLWIKQNETEKAQKWVESSGLDIDGEIPYFREDEFIVLAQVLIAQERWDESAVLVDKLLTVTKAGERWGRVIKLLTLQAMGFQAQGEQNSAVESFSQAISLASPEGYARTFLDLGQSVTNLLQMPLLADSDYVRGLLVALEVQVEHRDSTFASGLIEPISARELEVLRLLATELSGPEIAQELVIALSTLRTHTQQIYRKLGVSNRRAALKEAKNLKLL